MLLRFTEFVNRPRTLAGSGRRVAIVPRVSVDSPFSRRAVA